MGAWYKKQFVVIFGHMLCYLAVFLYFNFDSPWDLKALILATILIWVSVVDFDRFEIPDTASLLLALTGLAFAWQMGRQDMVWALVSGTTWAALVWAVGLFYARFRGFEGLGFGDVKLMMGIGAWLGFDNTGTMLLMAAVSGVIAITLISLLRRSSFSDLKHMGIAFGPFLCFSTWAIWLLRV